MIYLGELLFEWFESYWSNLFGYNCSIYGGNRLQGSGCHMSWCNISPKVDYFIKRSD